jgi:hypothetical protein
MTLAYWNLAMSLAGFTSFFLAAASLSTGFSTAFLSVGLICSTFLSSLGFAVVVAGVLAEAVPFFSGTT